MASLPFEKKIEIVEKLRDLGRATAIHRAMNQVEQLPKVISDCERVMLRNEASHKQ